MVLLVPARTNLPGSVLLKLLLPVLLVGVFLWGVWKWKKSGLAYQQFLSSLLYKKGHPNQLGYQLRLFSWYIRGAQVVATTVFVLNWVLFLSLFVSYRFSDLGVDQLVAVGPTLDQLIQLEILSVGEWSIPPQELHQQYYALVHELVRLQQNLQVFYPETLFPEESLWWLPLIRLTLLLVLVGILLFRRTFQLGSSNTS